jgi:hypothetical protein
MIHLRFLFACILSSSISLNIITYPLFENGCLIFIKEMFFLTLRMAVLFILGLLLIESKVELATWLIVFFFVELADLESLGSLSIPQILPIYYFP